MTFLFTCLPRQSKVNANLQKIKGKLSIRKHKKEDYQIKKMLDSHGCYGKLFHVVLKEDEDGILALTWEYENRLLEQHRRLLGKIHQPEHQSL